MCQVQACFEVAQDLSETERGSGGFGSTSGPGLNAGDDVQIFR